MFSISQFAIFRDILSDIEERCWALEEAMPVVEYKNFVGPWRVSVDVFGNIGIWKFYFNERKEELIALNKGISFPLNLFRPLNPEIANLLTRFSSLMSTQPCYKTLHSPLGGCDICQPFDKYRDNDNDDGAMMMTHS